MTSVLQMIAIGLFLVCAVFGAFAFMSADYARAVAAFLGAIVSYHGYSLAKA